MVIQHFAKRETTFAAPQNMTNSTENTDKAIIKAIKGGSYNAFEKVFKTYYEPLCRFAIGYLKDADASEELVQQVFFNYWERHDQIDINTSIKSYLFQSVRNTALNSLKHEQVKAMAKVELTKNDDYETQYVVEENELSHRIETAITKMPTERQKIFKMSRFEELKYKEIAAELNISIKTVENQMGKALKYLRTELAQWLSILLIFFTHK
ncbi:MAG: RNA polymerase sigma-70 factor [Bacteroidia bacterium]